MRPIEVHTPAASTMYRDESRVLLSSKVVIILGLLSAVAALSTDMYLALFPIIASDLHTTPHKVQLSITTFMVGLGIGQLFIGPLSDHYGRRKLLLGGMALLTFSCSLLHGSFGDWEGLPVSFFPGQLFLICAQGLRLLDILI